MVQVAKKDAGKRCERKLSRNFRENKAMFRKEVKKVSRGESVKLVNMKYEDGMI